ncbi:hypothetical protein, partial [Escherichia coli]|uniref:hypothetical protein n=1 Tax=Escherichia coli TaxID=562 RepID=UPI001BB2921E
CQPPQSPRLHLGGAPAEPSNKMEVQLTICSDIFLPTGEGSDELLDKYLEHLLSKAYGTHDG